MSDLLELATHFYAVAQHLEGRGREMLESANYLNRYADALCEQSIRDESPKPAPVNTDQQSVG